MRKFVLLLASPLYIQEREANAERSQVYGHLTTLFISRSDQSERPVALFFKQKKTGRIKKRFPMEKFLFFLRHQQVFGSNDPFFGFSNLVNFAKSLLDGNRDHMLAEARSELMKQEC